MVTLICMVRFARRYVPLLILTVIAGWLRFSAIGFGLPDQFRPDEEMTVPTALDFKDDWNPHQAIYPAAQTYLIHGVLRSYAALTGSESDWRAKYTFDNEALAFRIARQIAAAMGTATVPVMYFAAAPVFGPQAALASAAIVAVAFIHVRESKFAKVEVPAGFWLALSIAMMLRIVIRGRHSDYVLAGLFCGLAAATHYTAGAIAVGIAVAHLEARKREGRSLSASLYDIRIYLAGTLAILSFLCADPYFILDWQQTSGDLSSLGLFYKSWNGGYSPAGHGWKWLLLRAMPPSLGIGLEVFLLAALVWVIFHPRPGVYALLAFVVACFLSLTGGRPQLEFRYLVNPLMAMALLGGILTYDLIVMGRSWIGARTGYVAALAGALLLAPSVIRARQFNQLLARTDTRWIAQLWVLNHIPRGADIALIDGRTYGKPRISGVYNLIDVDTNSLESLRHALKTARWVIEDSFPPLLLWSRGADDAELQELDSEGELEFDIDSLKPDAELPICDPNDAFYAPFTHITNMIRPGPRIRIWRITLPFEPPR
jgi:hypothetical protein